MRLIKPFDQMEYHPISEKLVEILVNKTQNHNPLFFRVVVGYYFCKVASSMRVKIATHNRGSVPINMFALNLSPSGTGKGVSTGIMEDEVIARFRARFLEETFPALAAQNLPKIIVKRAIRKGSDEETEKLRVEKEYEQLGPLVFDFSEATPPAVKQMRHKLLMAEAGSINLEMDEIGSTLLGQQEVLTTFLELYDVGKIKGKLTKNTSDSQRSEEIAGRTPTNLLMFGEPTKLLDNGQVEEKLYSMLATGYARRCLFGYARSANKLKGMTAEQLYELQTKQDSNQLLQDLADHFELLADIVNANKELTVSRDVSLLINDYQLHCEERAAAMKEHEDLKKTELQHRYWKALKLAGAYAFVDDSPELLENHFYNAVKLVEDSGEAFASLLTRDRPYVKVAKYLATIGRQVTHADMVEDLPFYPANGEAKRKEMLNMAVAWGYKNNIIIRREISDQVEFMSGEALEETDLAKMVVAYSNEFTDNYNSEHAPWDKLHKLTQLSGFHWVNHHLANNYRNEENCIPGFNLIVIDVDGKVSLETAKQLMEGWQALYYTTKRHTDAQNRFRIILPMNYKLYMEAAEFTEFYKNIEKWLPFEVDGSCSQRSKKWMTHPGHFEYVEGKLFDVLPFIPKTSKQEEWENRNKELTKQNLDAMERWVLNNIGDGNRNNILLRYAMMLVDGGFDYATIQAKVVGMNDKLRDKLPETEIMSSIMVTVGRKVQMKKAA